MNHRICLLTFILVLILSWTRSNLYAQSSDVQRDSESYKVQIELQIKRLSDADFTVREEAQKQLLVMSELWGELVQSELESQLKTAQDTEVYERIQYILLSIPVIWNQPDDEPEVTKFIRQYKQAGTLYKLVVMEQLRRIPVKLQLKVLDRIIQKESDQSVALFVAMAFWYWRPESNSLEYTQIVKPILDSWKDSPKPAAKNLYYLANYKQTRTDATAWFNTQFAKQSTPNKPVNSTDCIPGFIATQLAEYARREAESQLSETDIPDGKKIQFENRDFQMKSESEISIKNGKIDVVRTKKNKGISIANIITSFPSKDDESYLKVVTTVPVLGPVYLLHRGLDKEAKQWLDRELSPLVQSEIDYKSLLAESFFEYGCYEMSVRVLNSISHKKIPPIITARKEYFHACWEKEKGNPDGQWEHIQKALKANPMEVDSLIMQSEMCYVPAEQNKVSSITDEVRKVKEEELENKLSAIEKEIENGGFDITNQLNEYAWLAVKTNRHLDKALKYAQEVVEADSSTSAFIDTLAHVYAARNDIDKAIETQTQAVEIDPNSNALYVNLQNFIEMKKRK